MKKIFIKTLCVSLILSAFYGCTDFVDESNVDPDLLTDVDSKNLFQGALIANQFFQNSSTVRNVMLWLNQANGENRQYVALNNWNNATASEFDDSWNNAYVNCITQAKLTQNKAAIELNPRLQGAAQVIEAHCMGTIAALWGDAPYTKLDVSGNNLTPQFDSQIVIYEKLQILLDEAIENLEETTGVGIPISKDIYYNGNASKWIKLAYSLKARFYIHTKNYNLAKSNAVLGIDNPDDDFKAIFGNASYQNFNPFYSFLVYDRDDYMSGDSYAARILDPSHSLYRGNAKTDESARFMFNYLNNGEYFDPYTLNIYGGDYCCTNGKFGSDSPMPMVTYGEMLLIIAEVDTRTSFANGLTSYNTYRDLLNTGYSIGIDNSGYDSETFSYLPYESADFDNGGIENTSSLTPQNALLREIFQERYIYFIGSFEAYNDFGRSNNMAGIQLKPGFSNTPERFLYPQVEINSNPNTPRPIPSIHVKTPLHQ
jgi:hypothetical protein